MEDADVRLSWLAGSGRRDAVDRSHNERPPSWIEQMIGERVVAPILCTLSLEQRADDFTFLRHEHGAARRFGEEGDGCIRLAFTRHKGDGDPGRGRVRESLTGGGALNRGFRAPDQ